MNNCPLSIARGREVRRMRTAYRTLFCLGSASIVGLVAGVALGEMHLPSPSSAGAKQEAARQQGQRDALRAAMETGRPYDTGLLKSEQGAADSTCGVVVEVMGGVLGTRDRETGEMVWQRTRLLFEIPLERESIKRIAILSEDGKPLPLAVDPALVEGSDYVTGATVTRAEVYVEHSPGFTFRLRLYP